MSLKMPTKAQRAIIERQEGFRGIEEKPKSEESQVGEDSSSSQEKKKSEKVVISSKSPTTPKKRPGKKSAVSPSLSVSEPLVPQTFKIPQSLSEKIKIISVTRKVKKEWPYTQQDIVSEALADWFKKIGE